MSVRVQQCLVKLAGRLQDRMARHSLQWQKRMLLAFCAAALSISIGISYWSIAYPGSSGVQLAPIQMPVLPRVNNATPLISREEYERICKWRHYLDSAGGFGSANSGLPKDSRAWTLRDTLRYLEQVYLQQSK